YKAIKAGRSFATTGPSLALDVNGELMGDTAYVFDGTANVNLSVDSESPTAILVKIDIIKNGDVWQTIRRWRDRGRLLPCRGDVPGCGQRQIRLCLVEPGVCPRALSRKPY
ncbi:MAG: hypothetical protein ACYSVY_28245, partial [Planctomycetota bacterium]